MPVPFSSEISDDATAIATSITSIDEVFYNGSGAALVAGDWVEIDTSDATEGLGGSMKAATANAETEVLLGVVIDACADGTRGRVRRHGLVEAANVTTGVTAGPLEIGGTAGRAIAYTNARIACGVSLATAASNLAPVFVRCL